MLLILCFNLCVTSTSIAHATGERTPQHPCQTYGILLTLPASCGAFSAGERTGSSAQFQRAEKIRITALFATDRLVPVVSQLNSEVRSLKVHGKILKTHFPVLLVLFLALLGSTASSLWWLALRRVATRFAYA